MCFQYSYTMYILVRFLNGQFVWGAIVKCIVWIVSSSCVWLNGFPFPSSRLLAIVTICLMKHPYNLSFSVSLSISLFSLVCVCVCLTNKLVQKISWLISLWLSVLLFSTLGDVMVARLCEQPHTHVLLLVPWHLFIIMTSLSPLVLLA